MWRPPRVRDVLWGYCTTGCDGALVEAAERLGLGVLGGHVHGFGGKSLGAVVAARDGARWWLKVSGRVGGDRDGRAEAELAAARLTGLPKPHVERMLEWRHDRVVWRATVMTLAPSPAASLHAWLGPDTQPPPPRWFRELRDALGILRRHPARRKTLTPEQVKGFILNRFGPRAPGESRDWGVCHGDLQWSNVTTPGLMLLDWEGWGWAPRGYDAARLLAYAASVPAVQDRVRATFADELDTASGRVAQLTAFAMVKGDIDAGHADPALGPEIDRMAAALLPRTWTGMMSRARAAASGLLVPAPGRRAATGDVLHSGA